jgi:phosphotransferase system IIB component
MNAVLNYNKLKTKLTIIDILKLLILTKTIPESAVDMVTVGDQGGLVPDNIVGNSVNDDLIEKDNQTVQIVNRTNVSGLGGRLAKMITNMGGNVILVMSEDNSIKKSAITYLDKETYTVDRLKKILGYEVVREPSNAMADITIIIGEDKVNSLPF